MARIKWILLRPTIEYLPKIKQERTTIESPSSCHKCGKAGIVRLLLNYDLPLSEEDKTAIAAGRAIFVPSYGPRELTWVCVHCSPKWLEVKKQVADEEGLQIAMEKAAAVDDVDQVAGYWATKTDLNWQRVRLLNHLLN
jgi:hypothetical protein